MGDTEALVEHSSPSSQGPGRREWRILAVVLVGSFMAVLDTTIVNVALPGIAQGIKASSDSLGAGIYFPAISATVQWQFSGDVRSRALGYLGGMAGISTALGAAWLSTFGLPRTLAAERAEENR